MNRGRKIVIHSHQYYAKGWLIGWTRRIDGRLLAIVEYEGGGVGTVDVSDKYTITFKEWSE